MVAQSRRGLVEWLCESQTDLCGEKYIVMGNELQAELILCTAFCCCFFCVSVNAEHETVAELGLNGSHRLFAFVIRISFLLKICLNWRRARAKTMV